MTGALNLSQQLQARWNALAGRERRMLLAAAAVVAGAVLWWLALAPALATLRAAQAQHLALDAQLQRMQGLQSQARALQSQPKMSGDDAQRMLAALLKQTLPGTAQMSVTGDRATVTLKGASADALAQWITQARINAKAIPAEVRLVRSVSAGTGTGAGAGLGGAVASASAGSRAAAWDGTVVLTLPAR